MTRTYARDASWRPLPGDSRGQSGRPHVSDPESKAPPRRSGGTGGRQSHSDPSTYLGPVRTPEDSPVARTYPSTPRRQAKHSGCSDNHGIRAPPPEQYLTPLQQKEVCIRHLRARLRDNVERLQHRDYEIDELRNQLYRMQEDWIEEECHRVEAQLALKEARREILHLQEVVESVRSSAGVREDPHDHKSHAGLQRPPPGGKSRSCGCSPASTLTRGGAHTRLSSEALQLERSEASRAARPGGQTHLLLEAALVSEGRAPAPPAVPRSATYERMCSGGAVLPMSHSCQTLSSSCKCSGHAFLPHHHLFLHLPQEEAPPTLAAASDPIPEAKPEVRSQACSPTMTWLDDDHLEDLSVISADVTAPEIRPIPSPVTHLAAPEPSPGLDPPPRQVEGLRRCEVGGPARGEAHTFQPHPTAALPVRQEVVVLETEDDGVESDGDGDDPPQVSHWSRYFLVDLLALAMPVVPTVAWLWGAARDVVPVYHIGSLLRGCCAVALHSLRRRGAGGGRRPAGANKKTQI
ncbi:syntaphilin isoform X1 [Takifugu rubripes]|uniref:syntaphilin isoform X1 n=1 Tax=Takifugu rubripes TaxID=31033 RepID=UPI001145F5E6|nr:syntaphilin-like isoform X1 [Takifugu rubripes]